MTWRVRTVLHHSARKSPWARAPWVETISRMLSIRLASSVQLCANIRKLLARRMDSCHVLLIRLSTSANQCFAAGVFTEAASGLWGIC